ncbi:MAG: hypothetical protein QOI55_1422, partial [Actinomycetota bacterium]|nr:hypothetical protein [Actinomycetota bacterium]
MPSDAELEPREWQDQPHELRVWHREFVHARLETLALVEGLVPADAARLLAAGMADGEQRAKRELRPLVEWPA